MAPELMRRIAVLVLLTSVLLTAGCAGLFDESGNNVPPETPTETSTDRRSSSPTETQTMTSSENQNLSERERRQLYSTRLVGELVKRNIDSHQHTVFHDYQGTPDNTVGIALQTDGKVPLERSIMDGAQTIAATIHYSTRSNRSKIDNITSPPVYEPREVNVNIHGPEGEALGQFEINPGIAREYRNKSISSNVFAKSVNDSYKSIETYDNRGNRTQSFYLNRSELEIWVDNYKSELRASDKGYEKALPVDNIRSNATKFEVLHEFEYSIDEYGANIISAKSTMYGSYWRTSAIRSWARTPERLNLYAHMSDVDEDFVGHMDKENVVELIEANATQDALINYQNQDSTRWVEKDEEPFENF